MKFEITKEEKDAIKFYKNEKYHSINQLLSNNIESDLSLIGQDMIDIDYTKDVVLENIDIIKKMYEAMIKNSYNNPSKKKMILYKLANIAEIDSLKNEPNINKFLLGLPDKQIVKNQISGNIIRTVLLEIETNTDVACIELDSVLEQNTDEIMISPFTKAVGIEKVTVLSNEENNSFKEYKIILENQNVLELDENDKQALYEHIVENADNINKKIKECIELDSQTAMHYENIRKLEQLLAKHNFAMEQENYERDTTPEERQSDLDDINRINFELNSLKDSATNTFKIRQENIQLICDWKSDISTYLNIELNEIKKKFEANLDASQYDKIEVAEEEKKEIENNPKLKEIEGDCKENIAVVNTLLKNINDLISKQQNHARIADEMDSHYKALNNAFEMKNHAEQLDVLVKNILTKLQNLSSKDEDKLDKISKTNLQVSVLLNYLNNAKAAVARGVTRFDEISIIEENELKKEIAETIKNIRCEAELKKLRDDIDIIQEKSSFKRFIGRFTGSNKIDQTILDQIKVKQVAIKKTFKTKMPLARNYSIHELIAEIEMFIRENEDDELVLEEVSELRRIKDVLKRNFVIIDSKVMSIVEQKMGKNLPLPSKKLTKKEIIEIDTYRFLNQYGYDKSNEITEPEYQDTVANEIKRIVDYIRSSDVL